MLNDNMKNEPTRAIFLEYQMRSINLELERLLPEVIGGVNCTLPEFYIMRANWEKGMLSHSEIAAHASLEPAELKTAIKSLLGKNIIVAANSGSTLEASHYKLTVAGSRARDELMKIYTSFISNLYAGLTEEEIDKALFVVMKLHENIHRETEATRFTLAALPVH